jgi:hypothetical protein
MGLRDRGDYRPPPNPLATRQAKDKQQNDCTNSCANDKAHQATIEMNMKPRQKPIAKKGSDNADRTAAN